MGVRVALFMLTLLGVTVGFSAQEATDEPSDNAIEAASNGEWTLIDLDVLTLRVPPDWIEMTVDGMAAAYMVPGGGSMSIQILEFDEPYSLDQIEAELAMEPYRGVLLDMGPVSFPFGDAILVDESSSADSGQTTLDAGEVFRQNQYLIPVANRVVLLAFGAFEAPQDFFAIERDDFTKVMNTVQIDTSAGIEPAWPAYTTDDGRLTVQAPHGFAQLESDNPSGLSLQHPDDLTLVILSTLELDSPVDVRAFEAALINNYEDNGDTVVESELISLPIGDTVFVHAETAFIEGDGTVVPQREYRYVTVRDTTVITVTLIVDEVYHVDYVAAFITLMDTLRLNDVDVEAG